MKHLCGILFLLSFHSQAQVNPGPRYTSMASAAVALQGVWSLQKNQAGVSRLKNSTFALGYEKTFNEEVSTQSALLYYPVKSGGFGLSFQKYGFSSYNLIQAGFSLARSFGPELSAAIQLNYHQLTISGYGNSRTYSVEAGLQYFLSDKFCLGAHVSNPGIGTFSKSANADIPTMIEFGASYQFNSKVLIAAEIQQIRNYGFDTKAGLEYNLIKWFAIRGGVSANPFKQYGGFGINYQKINMDVAVISNPVTGYSPQIALQYEF